MDEKRKMTLTSKQVLGLIIVGIENKQYQAAINLARDCINQLDAQSEPEMGKWKIP